LSTKYPNPARRTSSTFGQPRSSTATAASRRRNQSDSRRSKTSPYSASFDGKWCRRLGRRIPTPAAMSFSDVPSYPVVAKQMTASSRISSRVVRAGGVTPARTSIG
jgi:hypothetical protein